MKLGRNNPFTLLLCLLLITFILYGPYIIKEPTLDNIIDKAFVKEENWKGVITIWDYPRIDGNTGYKYAWIYRRIKEFERKYPGVFIEFKSMDKKEGLKDIELAIKNGDYPDIAPIGAEYGFQNKRYLTPLNKYLSKNEIAEYKEVALKSVTKGDTIYGLPYMMDTYCILLNNDLFSNKGVDLPKDGIWRYDEFVQSMKTLTYDENGDGKVDKYGFNSYIEPNVYYLWGILLSDGASIINNGEYSLVGENAISGLQKIIDLKKTHGVTPDDFGNMSGIKAWRLFAVDKKVAAYPTRVSNANILKILSASGKGFSYSVAMYPIGDAGLPISPGNTVNAYGILKQDDKEKEAMCVEFIKYLCSDKQQLNLVNQGVFPVKKNIQDIYKNDRIMYPLEKGTYISEKVGDLVNWSKVDMVLQDQIRKAIMGEKTAEEAINDAYVKVDALGSGKDGRE